MTYTEEVRATVVWSEGLGVQKPLRTQLGGRVRYTAFGSPMRKRPGFVKHQSPHLFNLDLALERRKCQEQDTTL